MLRLSDAMVKPNLITDPDPLTNGENPFVVVAGAVYIRVLGGGFLAPVPGGGASGCFSVDLPQRITKLY